MNLRWTSVEKESSEQASRPNKVCQEEAKAKVKRRNSQSRPVRSLGIRIDRCSHGHHRLQTVGVASED